MHMTKEALDMIELDAAIAPLPMLKHYLNVVRSSVEGASQDVVEHARALLLKLDHLANSQCAEQASTANQEYLAPWLSLAEPERAAA